MRARRQRHLLWKSMTFIKRQHVLLRLIFFACFDLFSFVCWLFFFFPNLTVRIFVWAVSLLSSIFACHNVGCYFGNQRNLNFFWLTDALVLSREIFHWFRTVLLFFFSLHFRVICTICLHRFLVGSSWFTGMLYKQNYSDFDSIYNTKIH